MNSTLETPAKVNLYLAVGGLRPDGYHELTTVFQPVPQVADTLTVEMLAAPGLELVCAHPDVPLGETNLCLRAARKFAAAAGLEPAWRLHLEKRIPVGGGLGGGSSDAAATLRLLNALHAHPLSPGQLQGLAVKLGADVPFFLQPQLALATGIGEILQPLPGARPLPLILLNPLFPVSTAWSFQHYTERPRPPPPPVERLCDALAKGDLPAAADNLYNELEPVALWKFPLLESLLAFLREAGCLTARLSGSGSTVFGIPPAGQAAAIAAAARQRFGEWLWILTTAE